MTRIREEEEVNDSTSATAADNNDCPIVRDAGGGDSL